MSKVIIYLPETEFIALQQLAVQEYRATKAQAALMIRGELNRLGLIITREEERSEGKTPDPEKVQTPAAGGK
jgi:hypothetical protein